MKPEIKYNETDLNENTCFEFKKKKFNWNLQFSTEKKKSVKNKFFSFFTDSKKINFCYSLFEKLICSSTLGKPLATVIFSPFTTFFKLLSTFIQITLNFFPTLKPMNFFLCQINNKNDEKKEKRNSK